MTALPPLMNVNWYITCTPCKHYQFIDVIWFKKTRDEYGKDKPMTWDRLRCSKCGAKNIVIARTRPLTKQQYARKRAEEVGQEAQTVSAEMAAKWGDYFDDFPTDDLDEPTQYLRAHNGFGGGL